MTAGRWWLQWQGSALHAQWPASDHIWPLACVILVSFSEDTLVNGVGCVSLGHGLRGSVVGHAYYGTAAVLRDLSEQPGWREGRVTLAAPLLPSVPSAAA